MQRKHLPISIASIAIMLSLAGQVHSASHNDRIAQCKQAAEELRNIDPFAQSRTLHIAKYVVTWVVTEKSPDLIKFLFNINTPKSISLVVGYPIDVSVEYISKKAFTWLVNNSEEKCLKKAESGEKFDPVIFLFDKLGTRKNLNPIKVSICHDGSIYTSEATGSLYSYRHNAPQKGENGWSNEGAGIPVGYGWEELSKIICAQSGILYAIDNLGNLLWYKHEGSQTDTDKWSNKGQGVIVGSGWGEYQNIFYGGDGVIYATKNNGDLTWHRHYGWEKGNKDDWANGGKEIVIGNGWNSFLSISSAGDGIIYAMKRNGDLLWYKHDGWKAGKKDEWDRRSGILVGEKWDIYDRIFATNNGLVYAITKKNELYLYKYSGWMEGDRNWSNRILAKKIW